MGAVTFNAVRQRIVRFSARSLRQASFRPSPKATLLQCRTRSSLQARKATAALTIGLSGAVVGAAAAGGGFGLAAGAAAVFASAALGDDAAGGFDAGRVVVRGFAASAGLGATLAAAGAAGEVAGAMVGGAVEVAAGGTAASTFGAGAGLAGAGAAAVGAGSGFGKVAVTAVLQPADNAATFFCRHCNASLPPGVTPEHFDMKSLRQFARIALCCSAVTWASTVPTVKAVSTKPSPKAARIYSSRGNFAV